MFEYPSRNSRLFLMGYYDLEAELVSGIIGACNLQGWRTRRENCPQYQVLSCRVRLCWSICSENHVFGCFSTVFVSNINEKQRNDRKIIPCVFPCNEIMIVKARAEIPPCATNQGNHFLYLVNI